MNRNTLLKRFITLCLCFGLFSIASAQDRPEQDPAWPLSEASPDSIQFDFKLKGYVLGLRMIRAQYIGHYNEEAYAARANLKTSGLGAVLKKLRIWAITTGDVDGAALNPIRHVQQNLDKKNRRVEMDYDNSLKTVSVDIVPPLGSQGLPPASPSERFEAEDTISAILAMMLQGRDSKGPLCNETVPVFDSKQRYNLRMVRAGTKTIKFDGTKYETVRCHVFYEPVSGFDPEDLPEADEKNTPVKVYFTAEPLYGLHVPLRFTYKVGAFKAVIKVSDLKVTPPV